jgi:hypothetical protein
MTNVSVQYDAILQQIRVERFFLRPSKAVIFPQHLQVKIIQISDTRLLEWITSTPFWTSMLISRLESLSETEFRNLTQDFFIDLIQDSIVKLAPNSKRTLSFMTCWTRFPIQRLVNIGDQFTIQDFLSIDSPLFEHMTTRKRSRLSGIILESDWYQTRGSENLILETVGVYLQGNLEFYIPSHKLFPEDLNKRILAGFLADELSFLILPDQWELFPDKIQERSWNLQILSLNSESALQSRNERIYASDFSKQEPMILLPGRLSWLDFYVSGNGSKWNYIDQPSFSKLILTSSHVVAFQSNSNSIIHNATLDLTGQKLSFDQIKLEIESQKNQKEIFVQNYQQIGLFSFPKGDLILKACPKSVFSDGQIISVAMALGLLPNEISLAGDEVNIQATILVFISLNSKTSLARVTQSQTKLITSQSLSFVQNAYGITMLDEYLERQISLKSRLAHQWINDSTLQVFITPKLSVQYHEFENGDSVTKQVIKRLFWFCFQILVRESRWITSSDNVHFSSDGKRLEWGMLDHSASIVYVNFYRFQNKYYHSLETIPSDSDSTILTTFHLDQDSHTVRIASRRRFLKVIDSTKPITDDNLEAITLSQQERVTNIVQIDKMPSLQGKSIYFLSRTDDGIEQYIVGNDTISSLLQQCLRGTPIQIKVEEGVLPTHVAEPEIIQEDVPLPPGYEEDIIPPAPGEEGDEIPPPPEEIEIKPTFVCEKKTTIKDSQRIFLNRNGGWIVWDEIQELLKDELSQKETKEMLRPLYENLSKKHQTWLDSLKKVPLALSFDAFSSFFEFPWQAYGFFWFFSFKSWKTLYLNPPSDLNRFDLFAVIINRFMPLILYETLFPSLKTCYQVLITPYGPWCWNDNLSLKQAMEQQFAAEVYDVYMENGFGYKILNNSFICDSTAFQTHFSHIAKGLNEKQVIGFKTRWDKYIKDNISLWSPWISSTWFIQVTGLINQSSSSLRVELAQNNVKQALINNRNQFEQALIEVQKNVNLSEIKQLRSIWLGSAPLSKLIPFQKMQASLISQSDSKPSQDEFTEGLWKFLIDKTTPDFYEQYLPFVKAYAPNSKWKDNDFQLLTDIMEGKAIVKAEAIKPKAEAFNRLNLFFGLNYEVEQQAKNPKPHKIASRLVILQKRMAESSPLLDWKLLQLILLIQKVVHQEMESGKLNDFDQDIAKKMSTILTEDLPFVQVKIQNASISTFDPSKALIDGEVSNSFSCPPPKGVLSPISPAFLWREYGFIQSEFQQFGFESASKEEDDALLRVFTQCSSIVTLFQDYLTTEWYNYLLELYSTQGLSFHLESIKEQVEKITDFKEKLHYIRIKGQEFISSYKKQRFEANSQKSGSDLISEWQNATKQTIANQSDPVKRLQSFESYASKVYNIAIPFMLIQYLWVQLDLDLVQSIVFQSLVKNYL